MVYHKDEGVVKRMMEMGVRGGGRLVVKSEDGGGGRRW